MDLSSSVNLQASKPSQSCVRVTWTKKESGACFVKYTIKFKIGTGDVIYTEIGYNIGEMKRCGIPSSIKITDVDLTMTFKSNTNTFQHKVLEGAIPTTKAPKLTGDCVVAQFHIFSFIHMLLIHIHSYAFLLLTVFFITI